MLFVHDCCNDDAALRETASLGKVAHRADHGGDTAFHVLRAAAVKPAVADLRRKGSSHSGYADSVGMPTEHQ